MRRCAMAFRFGGNHVGAYDLGRPVWLRLAIQWRNAARKEVK